MQCRVGGFIGWILLIGLASSGILGQTISHPGNDISYDIVVRLDIEAHTLCGEETIVYTNRGEERLNEIYLYLYPNRFLNGNVFARVQGPAAYTLFFPSGLAEGYTLIETLTVDGAAASYVIEDILLRIDLAEGLPPGASTEMRIAFTVKIPNTTFRLGHDDGNYYLTWWYPQVAVYDEEGWGIYCGHTYAEPYQEFARYRVSLTVPVEMVVGATGTLEGESRSGDMKTLVYAAEDVHDFVWVADARYEVEELDCDGSTVRSLYLPEHRGFGKRAAQYACDALRYFGDRFGPYPYMQFTVAETGCNMQMEYPQLIMLSREIYALPLVLLRGLDEVIAHETAHQWWFGMLMNDQGREPWLDEGFATYSEVSYMEQKYGESYAFFDFSVWKGWLRDIAEWAMSMLGRGLTSRRLNTEGYLDTARTDREEALVTSPEEHQHGRASDPCSKGFLTLAALEYAMGTELFDRILRTYAERFRFRRVTTQDFIDVAEDVTGEDLAWFFDQWLFSTKRLDFVLEDLVTSRIGGRYMIRAILRQNGEMRMPVDVRVTLENGEMLIHRWDGKQRLGALTFFADAPARSAVIDPDRRLPDIDRENNVLSDPVVFALFLDHGFLCGRWEEGFLGGFVGGIRATLPLDPIDCELAGSLGYFVGRKRLVWESRYGFSWRAFGKRLSFSVNAEDDGYIKRLDGEAELSLSHWSVNGFDVTHRITCKPFAYEVYHGDPGGDLGRVRGVEARYVMELDRRPLGGVYSLSLSGLGSFATWGSEFPFLKGASELTVLQHVGWRTDLVARAFLGWKRGEALDDRERFDINEDGGFRTFSRRDDRLTALSVNLLLPTETVWGLSGIPFLAFRPIVFASTAWAGEARAWRAEAGLGVALQIAATDLVRLELPLWFNTTQDGGRAKITFGFELDF
jgi:hypothetical protein